MSATEIQFESAQGVLSGLLVVAPADGCNQCVLLCHGYASHRDGFQLPALAEALAAAGFNSFRFDFSGNGASQGVFRFAGYAEEVAQIAAAKRCLEQQHGQRVVALLGHSKGGDDVILYAAQHDDIPLVINVAGRFHMDAGITMRFGADIFERTQAGPVRQVALRDDGFKIEYALTREDLHERVSTDMAAAAASIQRSQVLTIHGTADAVIPVGDGRAFAAAIPGSRLVEVEGADHNFRGAPHLVGELVQAVVGWLQEQVPRLPQDHAQSM